MTAIKEEVARKPVRIIPSLHTFTPDPTNERTCKWCGRRANVHQPKGK